jgi:hypothetical protein
VGAFDEPLMKYGMDAVFDAGAVGGKHGAFGGALAHQPGLFVGNPDFRQIAGADELGQGERIDFVGFDFGAGDGFGAQRVADHDFVNQRLENGGDGPGIGGGFDGGHGGVRRKMGLGESFESGAGGREAGAVEDAAVVVEQDGFDFFLVEIETGECHNC